MCIHLPKYIRYDAHVCIECVFFGVYNDFIGCKRIDAFFVETYIHAYIHTYIDTYIHTHTYIHTPKIRKAKAKKRADKQEEVDELMNACRSLRKSLAMRRHTRILALVSCALAGGLAVFAAQQVRVACVCACVCMCGYVCVGRFVFVGRLAVFT